MKYRNALNIDRIVLVYNAVQVIFSIFIVIQVILIFITSLNHFIGFQLLTTNKKFYKYLINNNMVKYTGHFHQLF